MKRWLVALLILLAVLILVSPGIIGKLAKTNLDENINWLASQQPGVRISTEHFDRGWFTSEGRHRIVFQGGALHDVAALYTGDDSTADLPALLIDTRIDHGLVPFTSMSRESGSLLPGLASAVSVFQIDPGNGELVELPGKLYSDIGLSGASKSRFLLEAGSFEKDTVSAMWQGADLLVLSNPASGGVSIEGSIKPFSIEQDGERLEMGALTLQFNETRSEFDFSVGTFEIEMESLTGTSAGGSFSMGALALTADTSIDDSRLNGNSTFSIDDVAVPGMGNLALAMNFSMHRLDAESLQAIIAALRAAQEGDNPEAALQSLYPRIEKDVEKLVSSGAEIHFYPLDLTLPQGKVSTTLAIEFIEMDKDAPFSWSSVLLGATASMDMRLPVELYEFAQMMNPQAGSLIAMGILKRDGDYYVMESKYAQGLLTVNGAPLPIPLPTM